MRLGLSSATTGGPMRWQSSATWVEEAKLGDLDRWEARDDCEEAEMEV